MKIFYEERVVHVAQHENVRKIVEDHEALGWRMDTIRHTDDMTVIKFKRGGKEWE